MGKSIRHLALLTSVTMTFLLATAAPAFAQEVGFPCGRVNAYTAPTDTTAGSITIGTRTFVANAGSLPKPPPPIAVGAVLCLTGELDASGAFTALTASTFGEEVCGAVVSSTPALASAGGTLTIRTNAVWTLPVRAGTTFTSAQLTGIQCFRYELNAEGNAEVVAHARVAGATATPSQLPSTATAALTVLEGPILSIAAAAALLVILAAITAGRLARRA